MKHPKLYNSILISCVLKLYVQFTQGLNTKNKNCMSSRENMFGQTVKAVIKNCIPWAIWKNTWWEYNEAFKCTTGRSQVQVLQL